MTIWDVLKIKVTSDIGEIRRAYVQVLCSVSPETFSASEFLYQHEAYIRALNLSRTGDTSCEVMPKDASALRITRGVIAYMEPIIRLREMTSDDDLIKQLPRSVAERHEDIICFYTSLMALHDDFYSRIDINNWKAILKNDIIQDLDIVKYLKLPILASCAAEPLLPHQVWIYLSMVFGWKDPNFRLPKDYEHEKAVLAVETSPEWALSFSRFRLTRRLPDRAKHKVETQAVSTWQFGQAKKSTEFNVDFELYAAYRKFARDAIIEDQSQEAKKWFISAANIFDGDSDLFIIYFDYLLFLKENNRLPISDLLYYDVLRRLLEFYPEDVGYLVNRADYFLDQGQFERAMEEYEKLENQFPDCLMVLLAMAEAYQQNNRESDANKVMKKIQKRYESVQERLESGRSHSLDATSIQAIYKQNQEVMSIVSQNKLEHRRFRGTKHRK
ncbi:MAG: tetratricopeptide repeat protein [Clostridiaceae bacterium]|mgnify:CR=1 FL=1|nr:tetratricopeptide repeat protein [Clostridiaceae bacterium]